MDIPKNVLEIVKRAADRHGPNINAAVKEADGPLRRLPEYGELVHTFWLAAIQGMVYDSRHHSNVTIKRANGAYGGASKVLVGTSSEVRAIHQTIYDLRVGGTLLGVVLGKELTGLSRAEYAFGDGHYANAYLLESLSAIVPANKTVKQVVPANKLHALLRKAQAKANREAA